LNKRRLTGVENARMGGKNESNKDFAQNNE
jgi:hypothetical protein